MYCKLLSSGTYKYMYDADGNMTSQTNIATGAVTYYTWDYRNRLVEVKQESSNGTVLNDEKFTYDVNNNRIAVSLNGTPQLYTVYDGANPYMDFNGSGQLTERYLYNPNALSQFYGQVNASGNVQWFLTDNINSVRQVVSAGGTVLDAITYDPYGNILSQTNASNAPRFLYAGGAYDSLTSYDQFGRRYYSSSDGRWTSPDPLGFRAGDTNVFRYIENSPLDFVDPLGLEKVWIAGRGIEGGGEYTEWTGLFLHWFVIVQNDDGTYTTYSYNGDWVKNGQSEKGYTGWYWQFSTATFTRNISAEFVEKAYRNRQKIDQGKYSFWSYNCRHAAMQLLKDAEELAKRPSRI